MENQNITPEPDAPESEGANSRSHLSPGSELRDILIQKVQEDCDEVAPLTERQKSMIAGTISGVFFLFTVLPKSEALKILQNTPVLTRSDEGAES